MKLRIVREQLTDKSTLGRLYINGQHNCYTLEDPVRESYVTELEKWVWKPEYKIKGKTAIPSGTYNVEITYSNRFARQLPLILDVPDFSGVRIHPGNYPQETDGCILVGRIPKEDAVLQSVKAFDPLFERLFIEQRRGFPTTIEIVNSMKLLT